MRVAVYNQMFALDARSAFSSARGHWAVNFQRSQGRIDKRVDLERTLEIVEQSSADILGLAEVLEGQEKRLKWGLKELGYEYVYFKKGHRTEIRELHSSVAIASKKACKQIEISGFPTKHSNGGGGGMIDCHFSYSDMNIVNVHLASLNRKQNKEQLEFLGDYLGRESKKAILMGDFNISYSNLKNYFPYLDLVSDEVKTCSTTPGIRLLMNKALDHILTKGFRRRGGVGTLEGYSDHRLLYVDLEAFD